MKIIIDLDGVVFQTISTITCLYNEDHLFYKDFQPINPDDVNTWDFEELNLEPPEYIDKYFNQPRFFEKLELMRSAKWIINKLHQFGHNIIFCSSGSYPNLQLKRRWIAKHFSYADFIPVNLDEHKDKSHLDFSDCVFIDDVAANLETSNAPMCICFGKVYPWNKDWKGLRLESWEEVYEWISTADYLKNMLEEVNNNEN